MSVNATAAVWSQSKATGTTKLVLLAIADHADPVGVAWPSVGRLARMCRVSVRQVQKHLLGLEEIGELRRSFNEGRRGTNVYEILLDFSERKSPKGVQEPLSEVTPCRKGQGVIESGSPPSSRVGTPVIQGSKPPSSTTPEPLRTTKNQGREPAGAGEPGEDSPPLSDFEFVQGALAELFPKAILPLPTVEKRLLEAWTPAIVEMNPDDFEALVCWFVHADDEVRGRPGKPRKKWPRHRREFLENFTETIEKVREWWEDRGQAWWERKNRARNRAVEESPEEAGQVLPENWKEILTGKEGAA